MFVRDYGLGQLPRGFRFLPLALRQQQTIQKLLTSTVQAEAKKLTAAATAAGAGASVIKAANVAMNKITNTVQNMPTPGAPVIAPPRPTVSASGPTPTSQPISVGPYTPPDLAPSSSNLTVPVSSATAVEPSATAGFPWGFAALAALGLYLMVKR